MRCGAGWPRAMGAMTQPLTITSAGSRRWRTWQAVPTDPRGDREVLLARLRALAEDPDPEGAHADADSALLAFISDAEVRVAFGRIRKWYA
jgi:hypothetical protein